MSLQTGYAREILGRVWRRSAERLVSKPKARFVYSQVQIISLHMTMSDFELLRASFPSTLVEAVRTSSGERKYVICLGK